MKKPTTQPNNIDALSDRVAGLAGQQDRFWCELAEAMKRITTAEAKIEDWTLDAAATDGSIRNLVDKHNALTDACALRIGNLEHRANTQHSELEQLGMAYDRRMIHLGNLLDRVLDSTALHSERLATAESMIKHMAECNLQRDHIVADEKSQFEAFRDAANVSIDHLLTTARNTERRITINDGEINNLAKSVEHISQDATAHEEIIKGIEDQIVTLATAQQESFYQTANTEAIRRHEKRIDDLSEEVAKACAHHAIQDHSTDTDNAIAFLELAVQTLTSRIAALEARDTEKFAMRVIELLAGRLQ